jgi:hypothetical protein
LTVAVVWTGRCVLYRMYSTVVWEVVELDVLWWWWWWKCGTVRSCAVEWMLLPVLPMDPGPTLVKDGG